MTKAKPRSTWGSKRKRGKDIWELRYSIAGKRKTETFHGTASQADRRLAELRIKHEGITEDLTVSQFWNTCYHDQIIEQLAESSIPGYERVYEKDIEPFFGNTPLKKLSPRDVQNWLSGMTAGKARHAKAVLSAMLSRAFSMDLVDDNVAQRRYIMPKGKAKGQRSKDVYSAEELDMIFELCRGEIWESAFILSAFGSASREEAMSPMVDEVKFDDTFAVIPIVRGVQRLKGKVTVLDWTKTPWRQRDLVIPPPYSFRLKTTVAEAKERGDIWLTDDGTGHPLCPNLMANRTYKDWFLDKPIKYVPFSNLRNSYATVMRNKGIDPAMVSKMMGHSRLDTTYVYYDRPSTEDKIEAVRKTLVGNCGQKPRNDDFCGQDFQQNPR